MGSISILDGGMLYELNRYNKDVGEKAIIDNPELVKKIHREYINIGCQYITTANYGFKPRRQSNWIELTQKACNILYELKNIPDSKQFKMLACIPPFYESYQDGEITPDFIQYYETLIDIFEPYTDQYLIETAVSISHITTIIDIIKKTSTKPILVSVYPNKNITKDNISVLAAKNIKGLLINCCSYDKMFNFLQTIPKNVYKKHAIGFYCNKIDEERYSKIDANLKLSPNLETFQTNGIISETELYEYIKTIDGFASTEIIIGGCCGYGVKEMKQLAENIQNINEKIEKGE
jgi:S-methylmethionine-dependent homocysteine/selenocysteine methylase